LKYFLLAHDINIFRTVSSATGCTRLQPDVNSIRG